LKTEPSAKRKLSFNDKRALELLPERIDALRRDLDALEQRLGDLDFPAREPAAFEAATIQYGRLRDELEKAEDEWLALEILREGVEHKA
jgi:ATP-binding cassette subfamily F protein uup